MSGEEREASSRGYGWKIRGRWARRDGGLAPARRAGWGLREVGGAFWELWGERVTPYKAAAALEHRAPQFRACCQGLS